MDDYRNNAETHFADAGLALLMDRSAESDGEWLWEEYRSCSCTMPPELDLQCRRQIQRILQKSRYRSCTMRFLKRVGQLAAAFAVILCLSVPLVTSVEAIRIPVLNFFLKHSPRATAILFQNTSAPSQTQLEELCDILKFSIPDEYTLEVERIYRDEYTVPATVTSVFMAFQNANDDLLTIHVSPAEGSWSVDTENAVVTQLTIEGQNALLIEKSPEFQVLWINETQKLLYHVTVGSMNKTDFMKFVTTLAKETRNSNAGLKE